MKNSLKYFLYLVLLSVVVQAENIVPKEALSLDQWSNVIILNQGRQKPLHTFSKVKLLQFSTKSKIKVKDLSNNKKDILINAMEWLTRVLFYSDKAANDLVFRVKHPEVLQSLKLDSLPLQRNYSFNQLQNSLEILSKLANQIEQVEGKKRTAVEAEIYRLFLNITDYINLSASFQFAIPNSKFTIHDTANGLSLGLEIGKANSYFDIFERGDLLASAFNKIPIKDSGKWTKANIEIFQLSRNLYRWSSFYRQIPFDILPTKIREKVSWVSPWNVLETKNIDLIPAVSILNSMTKSFFNGQQQKFDDLVQKFNSLIDSNNVLQVKDPTLEILYNKIDFFYLAEILYGLVFLVFLFWLIYPSIWLYRFSFTFLLVSFLLHTSGILVRMIILSRPPVSNLFDTFVFVGWICVLLGLLVEFFQRKKVSLFLASLSGLILLLISGKYAAEGDTLQVLVAVLNSNFWLATHVVTISMGYAGVCFTGVTGHLYVLLSLFNASKEKKKEVFKMMYGMVAFGLIFSFIGTILGGIWADQSWGRFWGWDPKENGALLIVIWGAIMFHIRLTGWVKDFGFAILAVLGIGVVVFAWFGVNLLGVGLHSYGFTSGVFNRMMLFYLMEVIFVITALFFHYHVQRKSNYR